jgi:hypothetical protein
MAALTGTRFTLNNQILYQSRRILKKLTQDSLWDAEASFFEAKHPNGKFADAREELGFIPWYFNLPDDKPAYAKQWDQLTDTAGFKAPWGITTAERRHPHCSAPMAAATAASGMAPSGRLPPPKPLKA